MEILIWNAVLMNRHLKKTKKQQVPKNILSSTTVIKTLIKNPQMFTCREAANSFGNQKLKCDLNYSVAGMNNRKRDKECLGLI